MDEATTLAIRRCGTVFSSLSILACGFVFYNFYKKKELRTKFNRIVFCVTATDFISAVAFLLGGSYLMLLGGEACRISAFFQELFTLSQTLWGSCIAVELFFMVKLGQRCKLRRLWIYMVISWVIPIAIAIIIFLEKDVYGPGTFSCWVKQTFDTWRWVGLYGWAVASFFISLLLYIVIFIHMKATVATASGHTSNPKDKSSKLQVVGKKLSLYIAAYLIVWVWPNCAILTDYKYPIFFLLQSIMLPGQGIWNLIVFWIVSKRIVLYKKQVKRQTLQMMTSRLMDIDGANVPDSARGDKGSFIFPSSPSSPASHSSSSSSNYVAFPASPASGPSVSFV